MLCDTFPLRARLAQGHTKCQACPSQLSLSLSPPLLERCPTQNHILTHTHSNTPVKCQSGPSELHPQQLLLSLIQVIIEAVTTIDYVCTAVQPCKAQISTFLMVTRACRISALQVLINRQYFNNRHANEQLVNGENWSLY